MGAPGIDSATAETLFRSELAPVRLPELGGMQVSFAMCVNRMCANFGRHYGTELRSDGATAARYDKDSRYEILPRKKNQKKLKCRYCGAERKLHSARSLIPVIRAFLSESLPFVDCGNADCENYGRNAYESMSRRRRRRAAGSPYHVNGDYLKCQGKVRSTGQPCESSITLGIPYEQGRDDPERRVRAELALQLIRTGLSTTDAKAFDFWPATFRDAVTRFGERSRDYHAYRNAHLLKKGECGQEDATAVVVTDVLQVTLSRHGCGPARTQMVNLVLSAMRLERTWFLLAVHVSYLPEDEKMGLTDAALEHDIEAHEDHPLLRQWACLHTFLDEGPAVVLRRPRGGKKGGGDDKAAGRRESEQT